MNRNRYEVQVGVLGAGYWGKNIIRNLSALGVLRAVADPDDEGRARVSSLDPRVSTHSNHAAVLEDPEIDAVAIATPAVTHGRLVAEALAHDKHVFVEKPLCLDVDEAVELRRTAAARDRRLVVGHVLLYHPAFRALQETLSTGELGALRYVYSNRLSLGKIRREENALWSFAPHDISMILQLTGQLPQTVTAVGGQYLSPGIADTTLTHLVFDDDVQAHIFVSWLHPFKDHRLVVVGERAMAVFDDGAPELDKLSLYRHDVGWDGELPVVNKAHAEPVRYEWEEPLRAELRSFLEAVEGGPAPVSGADEGIRVLRVLRACQQALGSGERVPLRGRG